MATLFLRPGTGNDANDGLSFANGVKTITAGITAARMAPGDLIKGEASITGSLAGVSIPAGSGTVTLPSGNHKLLSNCDSVTNWTFAANITGSVSSTRVEGTNSIACTPAAAFATGQIARFDLGVDTNLSAFSAIHCYIDCGSVLQTITIKLCSDAGGTTVVNTLTYPGRVAATGFHSALFRNGAALSSTVRSIVFEVSADPSTTVLRIDALFACHDPSVTPNSINPYTAFSTDSSVAHNDDTAYDCSFMGIRHFLTDTTATLLGSGTSGVQTNCLWPHATLSSGTIYCWHGDQSGRLENSANNNVHTIQEAGTAAAISVYEGGYNRTDMSTQDTDGMTVIVNSNFQGCYLSGKSYTEIRRFIFIGSAGSGVTTAIPNFKQKDVTVIGMSVAPGFAPNDDCIYENVAFQGAATTGTIFGGARSSLKNCKISNAAFNLALSTGLQVEKLVSNRSPSYGLIFTSGSCRQGYNINGVVINNAATADLRCATDGVSIKAYESTLNGTTKLSTTGGAIICQNYNGDTAAVLGSQGGTTYSRDVTTLDTGASSSIRLLINSSSFNTLFPLFWELPTYNHTIASISGNACTVSMRIKKTHATNIAGRLEVKRGVILAADATTDLPSDTNWNTVTVSFTPTADGPVEVYIELWSTATTESIYIDPDSLVFTMGGVSYSNTNHRWNYGLPVTDFRANYSDPAIANVRSGTAYKYEANANNKTGTCAVPAAANVLLGVAVDATTGTFNEAARNVDPGVANVKLATNYKIQNASLTGTLAGGGGASPAYFIS